MSRASDSDREAGPTAADAALEAIRAPFSFRWLGHAGVSLDWAGRTLVFDPVVTRRLGILLARKTPLPEPKPGPDAVFVSHAHADHLHAPSLAALRPSLIVIPRGLARHLPASLTAEVVEMRSGETRSVCGFDVSAFRMNHPGWRHPFGRRFEPLGYRVSRDAFSVFHAGDTGRSGVFGELGRTAPPDVVFVPIGAYSPRFVLKGIHLDPEEAVEAAILSRARLTIPVHFATFRLSFEPLSEPLERFRRASVRSGLNWSPP